MAKNCGKHFKCVSKGDFKGLSGVFGSLSIGAIIAAVMVAIGVPGGGLVFGVSVVVAIFELCAFLHGGKLICIEDDACTIGRIMELIPVGADKSGFEEMDDDFTFNILPSPHSPTELLSEMAMSDPHQAPFMVAQPPSTDLGLGFAGVSVKFENIPHDTEVFHVEVKGCRVHDVCAVLKVMSFGAPIVAAICSIPLIGWVVCLIAAAIWLAITAAAVAIAWAATHNGDINDVYDPAAGELTAADPATGEGGDVVLVRGDWVYDAGHSGWNEIHPIRHVQKLTPNVDGRFRGMGKADPALVDEFKTEVLDVWCFHVGESSDPLVITAQKEPENQWHIHPLIDGCEEEEVVIK